MIYLLSVLALVMLWYSLKHENFHLRAACTASAAFYVIYAILDTVYFKYMAFFSVYVMVDALWFAAMVRAKGPLVAAVASWANLMLGVLLALFPEYWLLYDYYGVFWAVIHLTLLSTLTILPERFPEWFGPDDKPGGSFLAFVSLRSIFIK